MRNAVAFEHWQAALEQVCGRFTCVLNPEVDAFVGDIALHQHGALSFAKVRTNAQRIYRTRQHIAAEHGKYYFLIAQRRGSAQLEQAGKQVQLQPQEMVLIDASQPSEFRYPSLTEQLSFHLPRHVVEQHLGPSAQVGIRLGLESASGRLLAALVEQIERDHQQLRTAEGDATQDALLALLTPVLKGSTAVVKDRSTALWRKAQTLVEQHLTDPELSPAQLAQQLGISLRCLYRLFAEHGQTVARFIQEQRLNHIAQLLNNPHYQHNSITDLALRWGFNDSAHFSRVFKTHYGCSPRDWRQKNPKPVL